MPLLARLVLIALAALAPLGPAHAAPPQVEVVASHPSLSGELSRNVALYLHLSYRSDTPIRVQAKGFFAGRELQNGVRWNPSPAYPAGNGEAMAWIAYDAPTRLDELRIEVSDASWQPLLVARLPVDLAWSSARGAATPAPEWVTRLNAAQQDWQGGSDSGFDILDLLFGSLLPVALAGYFVLQILLARRYSGRWRIAAFAPLLVMIPAVIHAAFALLAGSNLWPIVVIFTAPFAFLYLCGLAATRWVIAGDLSA
jgi:hypothetical protein